MTTFKLDLHKGQRAIYYHPARNKLLVCGRRFGKSHVQRVKAILTCLNHKGYKDPSFPAVSVLAMPTLKQCRQVHWASLKGLLHNNPFVKSINSSDFRISFDGNRPDLLLRGANDDGGDGLRGLKMVFFGGDEFQDFKPGIFDNAIAPALADTDGSETMLCATPKGRMHPLHTFYQRILSLPDWQYFHFTTKDNPHFPRSQLRIAKDSMPPKSYNQEFRASFEDFEGQLFDQLNERHYVQDIPPNCTFYLGADWGDIHPALSVIALSPDRKFFIADEWYNSSGQPVVQDDFLQRAADFCIKYNIYRSYLPDDRPAAIIAARNFGKQKQIPGLQRAVQVDRNSPGIMGGVEIINSLFYQKRLFIKSSCRNTKAQFENYHRATDAAGSVLNKPAANQVDHIVDSARYCISRLHLTLEKNI